MPRDYPSNSNSEKEPDSDASSSENESPEEDNYEYGDFVVPDDEVSEAEEIPEPQDHEETQKFPKKRHRRLRRNDPEDLELVQENLGVSGHLFARSAEDLEAKLFQDHEEEQARDEHPYKRTKLDQASPESEVSDEAMEEEEGIVSVGGNKEQIKVAASIFGTDPNLTFNKEEIVREIFEPAEVKEKFITTEDEIVRETDVAERLQHRLNRREFPDEQEMIEETEWLLQKLQVRKPSVSVDNLRRKITSFLALYRGEKFEIPFIAKYRIHMLHPEIEGEQELWDIYRWDAEWGHFYETKPKMKAIVHHAAKNAKRLFKDKPIEPDDKVLVSHGIPGEIPSDVKELLESHSPFEYMHELHDLQHFIDVHIYTYKDVLDNRRRSYNILVEARKNELNKFELDSGLTVIQAAENINARQQIHKPAKPTHKPSDLAFEKLCDSYPEELKVINAACNLMKAELMSMPSFRSFVREEYKRNVRVYTYPTSKGKSVLDVFHPLYYVKHLGNGKSLDSFNDEIWAAIAKCERDELIVVNFRLPWADLNDDRILDQLKGFLLDSEDEDDIVADWNKFRTEVIKLGLEEIYTILEKEIRYELSARAEEVIQQKASQRFEAIITKDPFTVKDDEENRPVIFSFVTDPDVEFLGSTALVIVDKNGELQHSQMFKFLTCRKPDDLKGSDSANFKEEKKLLEQLILEKHPDLLLIGANSLQALNVRRLVGSIAEVLTAAEYREGAVDWNIDRRELLSQCPAISMGSMEIPKLFASSHRATRLLKDLNNLQRQATSLARYVQNPLAETLGLWSDPNENRIKFLNLHNLQKEVAEARLLDALEAVAVRVCCEFGADINLMVDYEHLRPPLSFISGLGPVKAHSLLECIRTKSKGRLAYRAQMIAKRMVTQSVYDNCAGFIKIPFSEGESDPLDQTRIHPEYYDLAKRVASSALEANDESKLDDLYVAKVMKNPSIMDDLDLVSYAQHLESTKGRTNMKEVLDFVVRELTAPFEVHRNPYSEPSGDELLYMCSRETPETLKVGSLVQAKAIGYNEARRFLRLRLESGLEATVDEKNLLSEKDRGLSSEQISQFFKKGNNVKGVVTGISGTIKSPKEVFFRVSMSLLSEDIERLGSHLKVDLDDAFIIDDSDWIEHSVAEDESKLGQKYVPRMVNHPKFRNIALKTVCEELKSKDIGECIFRPSSRGQDHITCTWKFYDFVYSHLDIIEEGKPAPNMLGKKFKIANETYDSLQEIIDRYIKPCEKLTKEAITHVKFKDSLSGGLKYIENLLRQEKTSRPSSIPYYFTISPQYPQFFILSYIPKEKYIEEFIKVKPKGLFFHEAYHPSMNYLISWFKRHYGDKTYQSQLARSKPPQMDITNHFAIPRRFEKPSTPGRYEDYSVATPRSDPPRGIRSPVYNDTPYTKTPHISAKEWAGGKELTKTPRADDWEMRHNYETYATPRDSRDTPETWGRSRYEEQDRDRSRGKPMRGRGRGGRDKGSITCHTCGEPGHIARECPKGGSSGRPRGGQSGGKDCFNCGQEGHFAKDCPNPSSSRRDSSRPSRGYSYRTEERQDSKKSWDEGNADSWANAPGSWSAEPASWSAEPHSGWTPQPPKPGDSQGWGMSSVNEQQVADEWGPRETEDKEKDSDGW
jgi:transcription elongation factor SPT6